MQRHVRHFSTGRAALLQNLRMYKDALARAAKEAAKWPYDWVEGVSQRRGVFEGGDYVHWGWHLEYPKLFPNDVNYTIGQSDYRQDWFFEQVPYTDQPVPARRSSGRAATWTINFTLPQDLYWRAFCACS
ncbi:hypothetical protein SBA3_4290006 [Candidatus Sulfopaludibacter sp. SbA3]|nr:hypothetical protein SBA3_4290006 [Candidatus Sulfopaludibacter sp. SbA3]